MSLTTTSVLKGMQVETFDLQEEIQRGIAAAQAGDKTRAYGIFSYITTQYPEMADAWVWLGGTSPSLEVAEAAFSRAHELDPNNEEANLGLRWVALRRQAAMPPSIMPSAESEQTVLLHYGNNEPEAVPVPAVPEAPKKKSLLTRIATRTNTPPVAVALIAAALLLYIIIIAVFLLNWH